MLELDVSSDVDRLMRRMTAVERRQVPFALAGALTSLAFDIRKDAVERTGPESFDLRDPRFLRAAIVVDKASKHDLRARVYDRLESSDLLLHARGLPKYPHGKHVAVPTKHLLPKRRARGVPKAWRPKQVMRKPRVFEQRWKGHLYIWRRKTKKRYPIEPLYLLVPRAQMRKRFPFHERARQIFRAELGQVFHRKFEHAMRTAK